jgi:S1-C subfamily serine protease
MLTAALVVAGGAAGIAVGHDMWTTNSASPAAASSTPSSNSSGSSGSGSSLPSGSGNGSNSGTSPFSGGFGNIFGNGSSGGYGGYSGGDPGSYFGGSSGDNGGSNSSSGTGATSAQAAAVAAKVDPALVDINSTFSYQQASGAGTGIVLTSNGLVLTNNHVIDGATKLSVTDVGNGKTYNATVLGYDASHDVALVKLQGASGLKTADLGDSSSAAVGQSVVAIGNAGGTGGTPSNAGGAVTALNQSITASDDLDGNSEQLSGLIQTNAGIQPGDSGGSLVNMSGQVIGMDTAASEGTSFSSSSGGATQGFAIPINEALSIVHQIESGKGTSTTHVGATAMLGVLLGNSSSNQGSSGAFGFGSGDPGGSGNSSSSGASISSVVSGGPAANAGLAAGDTITSLAGQSVSSPSDMSSILVGYHPGDKIQVGWVDSSGQAHTTTVDLGSGPPA